MLLSCFVGHPVYFLAITQRREYWVEPSLNIKRIILREKCIFILYCSSLLQFTCNVNILNSIAGLKGMKKLIALKVIIWTPTEYLHRTKYSIYMTIMIKIVIHSAMYLVLIILVLEQMRVVEQMLVVEKRRVAEKMNESCWTNTSC